MRAYARVCAFRLRFWWKRPGALSSVSQLIELFVWDSRYRDKATTNIFFPFFYSDSNWEDWRWKRENEAEKLFHIIGRTDIDCTKNCNRHSKFELEFSISRDILFLHETASWINLSRLKLFLYEKFYLFSNDW